MNRLAQMTSVARFITQGFFTEALAQVSSRQQPKPEMTARPSQEAAEVMAEVVDHHFEIAKVTVMEQIGDCFVDFRLYGNRITRMLKKPTTVRTQFERIPLADYTPAIAQQAKRSFTLTDAIALTRMELGAGGTVEPVEVAPVPSAPVAPEPAQESTSMPVTTPVEDDECLTGPVRVSQGRVIFAGVSTVTPKGRRPYNTFSVTVQTAQGDVTFSGVDLEKKFQAGQFGLNDQIVLTKQATEFKTAIDGKSKTHTKNKFVIEVLKKAS